MFDFYGVLPYEDVKHILDKYEVSETEYMAYLNYAFLDWDVSVECNEELAEYVMHANKKTWSFTELTQKVWERYSDKGYLDVNRLSRITWIMLGLWIVVRRKWSLFMPAAGVAIGSLVTWSYLIFQGRLPWRVTIPMFFVETAILVALIIGDFRECRKTILLKGVLIGLCIGFCYVGSKGVRKQYEYIAEQNYNQDIYIKGMYEMQDYCMEHPENRYLIDQYAMMYYRGSALDTKLYKQRNSVVSGSWYSNSPSMREKLKVYFEGASDNFRVILYKDGNEKENIVIKYLEEKMGKEAVEEESVAVSHGGIYAVFKFDLE